MNKKILRTEGCKPTTPTSIFRRWCVAAIILCFTMSANAQTDTNNGGVFHGLNDLTGKTLKELIQKATDAKTFSMDNPEEVFFLYNLETKQFLNSGSYWGTHVSLKYYGLPLWVDKVELDGTTYDDRINFAQNLQTGQGPYIAWILRKNSADDVNSGCYTDVTTGEATGWYFEPTNDGKNSYKIYTKPKDDSNTKYYLHGDPDPYADRKCEADKEGSFDEKYGKWRVFSLQQLYDIQEYNMENMTESLELSFKLRCPSFSRGDADIKNFWNTTIWHTGNANAKQRFGLEHLYYTSNQITDNNGKKKNYDVNAFEGKGTNKISSYTFPEGKDEAKTITIKSAEQYQLYLGKYFCADAKNTRGRIFQKVKVNNEGTYVIECKAFSNTEKAKLFAVVLDADGQTEIQNTLHTTVLWQIENMSKTQQEQLHTEEQNMDYAGRNFYSSFQYTNSVLVHVKKNPGDVRYIAFGIQIGDDEQDTEIADDAKEWTVFDDFRLLFAAKGVDTDLVLDEDAPNLKYLTECSNTYQNAILHLNKTIQTNSWTSIILPVNLTKNQFTTAFGANARLAELENVVDTEIRFATRNLQNMKDEDVALVAYKPYILYSTEVNKTTPAYQATLTETAGSHEQRYVRIKANHIGIPNVTFATKDNANDLSKMDGNWLTIDSYNDTDSQLTIHGTFARTFAPKSTQDATTYVWNFNSNDYNKADKGTIITGRPTLIGCYFFDKGKMWYSDSRPRGLRGFSCWIAPKNQETATPANAKLFLDGIDMTGTTDIEDIFGGEEGKKVEKFANGIYNINGQLVRANSDSTEGLPEGLYIINGKKRLVKH